MAQKSLLGFIHGVSGRGSWGTAGLSGRGVWFGDPFPLGGKGGICGRKSSLLELGGVAFPP